MVKKNKIIAVTLITLIGLTAGIFIAFNSTKKNRNEILMEDVLLCNDSEFIVFFDSYLLKILEVEGRFEAVFKRKLDLSSNVNFGYIFNYYGKEWILYKVENEIEGIIRLSPYPKNITGTDFEIIKSKIEFIDIFKISTPVIYSRSKIFSIDVKLNITKLEDNNPGWNYIGTYYDLSQWISLQTTESYSYTYFRISLSEQELYELFKINNKSNIIYGKYAGGYIYIVKYKDMWYSGKIPRQDEPQIILSGLFDEIINDKINQIENDKYVNIQYNIYEQINIMDYHYQIFIKIGVISEIERHAYKINNINVLKDNFGLTTEEGEPFIFYSRSIYGNYVFIFKYGNSWFVVDEVKIFNLKTAFDSINNKIYALDMQN